jgi:hypothetical protein
MLFSNAIAVAIIITVLNMRYKHTHKYIHMMRSWIHRHSSTLSRTHVNIVHWVGTYGVILTPMADIVYMLIFASLLAIPTKIFPFVAFQITPVSYEDEFILGKRLLGMLCLIMNCFSTLGMRAIGTLFLITTIIGTGGFYGITETLENIFKMEGEHDQEISKIDHDVNKDKDDMADITTDNQNCSETPTFDQTLIGKLRLDHTHMCDIVTAADEMFSHFTGIGLFSGVIQVCFGIYNTIHLGGNSLNEMWISFGLLLMFCFTILAGVVSGIFINGAVCIGYCYEHICRMSGYCNILKYSNLCKQIKILKFQAMVRYQVRSLSLCSLTCSC